MVTLVRSAFLLSYIPKIMTYRYLEMPIRCCWYEWPAVTDLQPLIGEYHKDGPGTRAQQRLKGAAGK